MAYSLCTLDLEHPTAAIEIDGDYFDLSRTPLAQRVTPARQGLLGLFEDWEAARAELERLASGSRADLAEARIAPAPRNDQFMAPLQYPGKVLCTGLNYQAHQEESQLVFPKEKHLPPLFLKPPRTTVVGSGASVRYPSQTEQLDYEVELTLVIGRRARHVQPQDAWQYVAGYMIAGDMSARDRQFDSRNMMPQDTVGGKGFDTSCPTGPRIIPFDAVDDPQNLDIELRVNGQVEISANTREMIWNIPELIAEATRHLTLEPGDIFLTGCPAGVGWSKGRYLNIGDKVDMQIGNLGPLSFEIIA